MKKMFHFACVVCALLAGTISASAFTKTWKESNLNNIQDSMFVGVGDLFTFSVAPLTAGEKLTYNSDEKVLRTVEFNGSRDYTLSWQATEGYTLSLQKISASVRSYGVSSFATGYKYAYVTIASADKKDVLSAVGTFTTVSCGTGLDTVAEVKMNLNRTGDFAQTNPFTFESISVDYTLVANAPVLEEEEINVEIGADSINLKDYFTVVDDLADSLRFVLAGETDSLIDSLFYPTEAGEFHVYAYVAGNNTSFGQSVNSDTLVIYVTEPTALQVVNPIRVAKKMLVNGQLVIVCDDQQYNAQGIRIR